MPFIKTHVKVTDWKIIGDDRRIWKFFNIEMMIEALTCGLITQKMFVRLKK